MPIQPASRKRTTLYHILSIKGLLVLILSSPILFLLFDRYYGVFAMRRMCANDGGEAIFATTYVHGYVMIKEWAYGYCVQCMADLPAHKFEFMDEYLPKGSRYAGMQDPGYYRFTLGKMGDPRCAPWESNAQYRRTKKHYGFKPDECLAVERLVGASSKHTWRIDQERIPIANGLFFVNRRDLVVYDMGSNEVLGRIRDYSYLSEATRFVATTLSGSANPDARCSDFSRHPTITALLQRTLRDPAKKPPP